MKRFPCGSKLCQAQNNEDVLDVTVQLKHTGKHVGYADVSMPVEALDMIRENVEWLTPVAMVTKVQEAFPSVTAAQIHRAWMEESAPFWRFDNDQLLSTKKLLEEHTDDIDIFEPMDIPEGVEMVCWGMKKIAMPLKGKIVEESEGTDNTNSKHLELYSIMGEQEGAGFPLSYLLLSAAFSIDQGKRTKALTAWAKCVRDTYSIIAKFTHVDKDMAEIGMLLDVWKAKISLFWWHLRRAVCTQLASTKLATTPYDPGRAHAEFSFIDVAFVPAGKADAEDFKRAWKKLESTPITIPMNPAYKTDTKKMLCTCLSLPTSRFLLCKHVVQGVEPVPPVFFLEVKRRRTAPFWAHPSLWPLSDADSAPDKSLGNVRGELQAVDMAADWDDMAPDWDDDNDDLVDTQAEGDRRTFTEAMDEDINLILEFAKGLKYQRQFRD
ncbi:hypothetical protein B0H10DRAFT_2224139 [Mycena sp. CBHHK59/15]|nr:hypothetical protein B0H10DRAFT_2224139 [Mycena sp. CBHHK59/15]